MSTALSTSASYVRAPLASMAPQGKYLNEEKSRYTTREKLSAWMSSIANWFSTIRMPNLSNFFTRRVVVDLAAPMEKNPPEAPRLISVKPSIPPEFRDKTEMRDITINGISYKNALVTVKTHSASNDGGWVKFDKPMIVILDKTDQTTKR